MIEIIGVGKVIPFPTKTEADNLKEELQRHEEEIKLCLDDLEAINSHIVELTFEYEQMLHRLGKLYGVDINLEGEDSEKR